MTAPILGVGCHAGPLDELTGDPLTKADSIQESKEPSGVDDIDRAAARMGAQHPLLSAARAIAPQTQGVPGFAGIELDTDRRIVRVRWKGPVPANLRTEIDHQGREGGFVTEIGAAAFAQNELIEAAHQVAKFARANGLSLYTVGPASDGNSLRLTIGQREHASSLAEVAGDIPVRWELGLPIRQTSRSNDSPPYWAGAVVNSSTGGPCSTGFAVARYFLFFEISRGILTAEHCAVGGNAAFFDGGGDFVGNSEAGGTLSDSLYIATSSAPRIYDGPVGNGEFSKPVAGSQPNFPGQFVCVSGAATGANCDIKTISTNNFAILQPSGLLVADVVLGEQISGNVATGPGDSGGPVFTLDWPDHPERVRAAGHMIGGDANFPVPCPNPGQTGCMSRVAWVDLAATLSEQGVSLLTQ